MTQVPKTQVKQQWNMIRKLTLILQQPVMMKAKRLNKTNMKASIVKRGLMR